MPKWGALSPWALLRKARPGLGPQNGMQFPQRGSSGKYIPEFAARTGRSFPMDLGPETVSQNSPLEWDTPSG